MIVLASQSPRRRELIQMVTRDFIVESSSFDENSITFEGNPSRYVERLAEGKASVVADGHEDRYVIGMDTIVYIDGDVLGKPASGEDAYRMMSTLQGRMHEVYTGFCIMNRKEGTVVTGHEVTDVYFESMDEEELSDYILKGDWQDKAGAYGIQGYASRYITGIAGDYFNVVGLPVNRIYRELRALDRDLVTDTDFMSDI